MYTVFPFLWLIPSCQRTKCFRTCSAFVLFKSGFSLRMAQIHIAISEDLRYQDNNILSIYFLNLFGTKGPLKYGKPGIQYIKQFFLAHTTSIK